MGCAVAVPGAEGSPKALLEEADRGLYKAKDAGRNQLVLTRS
jgi:PleD family two-component response regulator